KPSPGQPGKGLKKKLSAEEQKIIDDAVGGLFATPAFKTEQKAIEAERVPKFAKLARLMLSKGIDNPQAAADWMKANIGPQMLPYSQAVWDTMSMSRPDLYGDHDWDRLWAGT